MLFRRLLPSARARDSPARAERAPDLAHLVMPARSLRPQKEQVETAIIQELFYRPNPAPMWASRALAAKAHWRCRHLVEISPALAAQAEAQVLAAAKVPAAV